MTYDLIKIEYCNASAVGFIFRNDYNEAVDLSIDATSLYSVDMTTTTAVLTVEEEIDNGVRLFKTSLDFHTCGEITDMFYNKAFFCTAANGDIYLIGSSERPYPIVTKRLQRGDGRNTSQLLRVLVEWRTDQPPLRVNKEFRGGLQKAVDLDAYDR